MGNNIYFCRCRLSREYIGFLGLAFFFQSMVDIFSFNTGNGEHDSERDQIRQFDSHGHRDFVVARSTGHHS